MFVVWVVEIDLLLVLHLIVGDRTGFDFGAGIGIDFFLVWGSKITWFQWFDRS